MTNGLSLEELMKEGTYPEEYTEGENWKILHGDTLKLVKAFQPGIFDAVITDPPYASGGTKQNERNRTTNQKYSSMSAANALPDFDGDNKDQRSWTHWISVVNISPRETRTKSWQFSCCSSDLTCWLMAECVTFSSMAACVKLRCRCSP